jgi:superfamily I DNA and/or RNA helicase
MQHDTFRPRPDPRPDMEQALEQAIKLSVGKKSYQVSDGRLLSEEHRRYRYAYRLERSWDLADGTDLQLRSNDFDTLSVQLSSTNDDVITIVTGQRLPASTLDHAQLVADRAYLLRKLKEALDPVKVPSPPLQLGLKLFGHVDCLDLTAAPQLVERIKDAFTPDEAQRLAILRALESELLMILGPPGTGKTDVLAAIALLHSLIYKHRVLICSHTNIAIDNAMKRLVKFLKQQELDSWLEEHLVIRSGDPHLAELLGDDYRHVTLPLIVADEIAGQREEIARLEQRRDQVGRQITENERTLPKQIRTWEQRKVAIAPERKRAQADQRDLEDEAQQVLPPLQAKIAELKKQQQQAKRTMDQAVTDWKADEVERQPLARAYVAQQQQREAAEKKLKALGAFPPLKRFWKQLVTNEWQRDLEDSADNLATSLAMLKKQILPLQERQATAKATYAQAEQRCKELLAREARETTHYQERVIFFQQEHEAIGREISELDRELVAGNVRLAELEQAITTGRQERALLEEALARLDQEIIETKREAARKIVESAQIVGATLTSLYMNPTLLNQEWDVVVVDEGSMAPPPAVLVAAHRAQSHLIVVGDPLQLAPVCRFKEQQIKEWLGRDVFHHGGYSLEQADSATHHSVLLPYQGRMDSAICDLIRGPVYKGRLKDRNPHRPRLAIGPEPDSPVVLYDTSSIERARAEQPASRSSRFNRYQAELSIHLAHLVLADLPEASRKPECIGVVTPYTAHRDLLKELARGTDLEMYARIGTVHAFQGLEFDALIFDLVESPGLAIAPFLRGGWGGEAMRLLNVAITRAREKLLIVANMRYLRQEPSSSVLRQVTERACQQKRVAAADHF